MWMAYRPRWLPRRQRSNRHGVNHGSQNKEIIILAISVITGLRYKPKNTKNKLVEVRRFDTVGDSVAAYYRNINTHKAYRKLRRTRLEFRNNKKPLTAKQLIPTLKLFGARKKYLKILRSVFLSDYIQIAKQMEPNAVSSAPDLEAPAGIYL